MTALVELATVTTFVGTAASTMGLCGISNAHASCMEGVFKKKQKALHYEKQHHLDPPHYEELIAGPMKNKEVAVSLNQSSIGKRAIEFNGEILSMSSASGGPLAPAMALGGCDIRVEESRVLAVPPRIPIIELKFASPAEAQRWGTEFKEAAGLGPSHERIQELIHHTTRIHSHVADLRERAAKVDKIQGDQAKLKKSLIKARSGVEAAQLADASSSVIGSLFRSYTHDVHKADGEDPDKLHKELDNAKSSIIKHKWQSLSTRLKEYHADEDEAEEDNGAELETCDESNGLTDPNPTVQPPPPPSAARVFEYQQQAPQECHTTLDSLSQDFQLRLQDVEQQLLLSRQCFQEELFSSYGVGVAGQIAQASGTLAGTVPLQNLTNTREANNGGLTVKQTVMSLEERIRNHQLQVYQDCEVVQQAFKQVPPS